ncbi:MAG: hypothetical protein ACI865_001769 [Flavobacteriaceae bacterium]|jgi:hypothetical protein
MIKHSLKDDLLAISIDKIDFSYRIPIKKLGNTSDWKIGVDGTPSIVIKNVSTWMLQLFTKKTTDDKYIKQFMSIVQEHAPENTINWEDTLMAVNAQNEYNWLSATNKTADKKVSEEEILSSLEKKYKID